MAHRHRARRAGAARALPAAVDRALPADARRRAGVRRRRQPVLLEGDAAPARAPPVLWLDGDRHPNATIAAWRALAGLPLDFLRSRAGVVLVANIRAPVAAYLWFELDRPGVGSLLILAAGAAIVLLYGVSLRFFFASELILRPVVEDVAAGLPDGAELGKDDGAAALAAAGRAARDQRHHRRDRVRPVDGRPGPRCTISARRDRGDRRGFTLSFELSALLARTILTAAAPSPGGDASRRGGDSACAYPWPARRAGRARRSFNQMVAGLEDRETLREAFGAFVSTRSSPSACLPGGHRLRGRGRSRSACCSSTSARSPRSPSARARARVVARLNDFYGVARADPRPPRRARETKFIGDGLLGVFARPTGSPTTPTAPSRPALEIAELVRTRYGDELRIGIGVNSGPLVAGHGGWGRARGVSPSSATPSTPRRASRRSRGRPATTS